MPTKTAETVHGSVEYETVECASCGNETVKDDAKDFEIGDKHGKACEHCYRNGPVGFPEKALRFSSPNSPRDMFTETVLLAPIALPTILLGVFTTGYHDDREHYMSGVASGALGVLLWMLPVLLLWWFL